MSFISNNMQEGTISHNTYPDLLHKLNKYKKTLNECQNTVVHPFLTDLDNKKLPLFRARITGKTISCFIAHPEANGITYPMKHGHALELKGHTRNFRFQFPVDNSKTVSITNYTAIFKPGESKLLSIYFLENGSLSEIQLREFSSNRL